MDTATETDNAVNTAAQEHEFDLNISVYALLKDEPFFAALSRHIDKKRVDSVGTAGVTVNEEGRYELHYNLKWFSALTKEQQRGILKHEFYHLIFEHVTTRKPDDRELFRRWNIACDLAINSHIPRRELPDGGCIPGEGMFQELKPGLIAENYFAKLCQEEQDAGDGFDNHDGWGDENQPMDEGVKELAKQRLKEMMKEAAEEANRKSSSWGTISSEMRKEIMARITAKVNWRSVLRYFIKTSRRADKSSTVKRLNKRFPYIHPGKKVRRHANIAISIDQSGSVDDIMLEKFFAELNNLADLATFTVIPFDSEVGESKIFVWKKGQTRKAERVLCGGTDFDAPTKYVNGKNFDGHIILTDMCAPKPIASVCQRMWMTDKDGANNPYFTTNERVISVD